MTAAEDALTRARAEAYVAEEMGSPELELALARVEQAEEAVRAEGGDGECATCGCTRPVCDICAEECIEADLDYDAYIRHVCNLD